jgi:hypothetical protein
MRIERKICRNLSLKPAITLIGYDMKVPLSREAHQAKYTSNSSLPLLKISYSSFLPVSLGTYNNFSCSCVVELPKN